MALDEESRLHLYRRLEEVLGPEDAGTLMNHLPPAGLSDLATKADVRELGSRLVGRIDGLEHRLDGRVDSLQQRLDGRMDSLEHRLDGRVDSLEHRLTAEIERSGRRLVMWTSSMVLASAALAFAAGRVT